MKRLDAFLVYRASNQSLRVVTRRPSLAWDELAFKVTVNVPDPWGRLAGAILIDLPGGPAVVEVKQDLPIDSRPAAGEAADQQPSAPVDTDSGPGSSTGGAR